MRSYVERGRAVGKPVAITECGCGAHRGAGDREGKDEPIVWDDQARAVGLKGDLVRDEEEQATYVREVLETYDAVGMDAAFVYTFARYDLPHRDDTRADLDRASPGVVKVLDVQANVRGGHDRRYADMPWEPKAAFDALADYYRD